MHYCVRAGGVGTYLTHSGRCRGLESGCYGHVTISVMICLGGLGMKRVVWARPVGSIVLLADSSPVYAYSTQLAIGMQKGNLKL